MNQMGSNQYGSYNYPNPQSQQAYYTQPQGAQQSFVQHAIPPQMQPTPTTPQFQGGPLEASGGTLIPTTQTMAQPATTPGMLPIDRAYIENILRLNRGKLVTVHSTFGRGQESTPKAFTGLLESAGRDHILLKDPQTGSHYLLLMVYVDYITTDDELEHDLHAFSPIASYSPR
ncbi:MAG: spore coat protein GerQ [Bacillus sp. (in: firmicutes)]